MTSNPLYLTEFGSLTKGSVRLFFTETVPAWPSGGNGCNRRHLPARMPFLDAPYGVGLILIASEGQEAANTTKRFLRAHADKPVDMPVTSRASLFVALCR